MTKLNRLVVLVALAAAAISSGATAAPMAAPSPQGVATTGLVDDVLSGSQGSQPDLFLALEDTLYFVASDALFPANAELWRTQGDFSTTAKVHDFAGSGSPNELTQINGTIYFVADDPATGFEIWKTTGQGATLVRDINLGTGSSSPRGLTAVGDKLFFSADDGASGRELWVLDTVTGTSNRVADLNPGPASTVFFDNPTGGPNFRAVGDLLFFAADNGQLGLELWRSNGDGAPENTFRIDINPGAGSSVRFSSDPVVAAPVPDMADVDGKLFFAADDGVSGRELWMSDGSVDGTQMVADIRPGPLGSDPFDFVYFDNDMIFIANNGANGQEVWISNGQEAGTMMLADIRPGSASSFPSWLSRVGGAVYFQAEDAATGAELWVTNGSPSGTQMAADINPGPGSSFPGKAVAGPDGLAYFSADDGLAGSELWRSNGAPESTERMADINVGPVGSFIFNRLASTASRVYFQADDGYSGAELWSVSVCPNPLFKNNHTPFCTANPPPPPRKRGVVFFDDSPLTGTDLPNTLAAASEFVVDHQTNQIFLKAANGNATVKALDGRIIPFGPRLVEEVWQGEIYEVAIPDADFDGVFDALDPHPNDVDLFDVRVSPVTQMLELVLMPNGIPDAYEDEDGDGLTLADELYFGTKYDPKNFDTNGNGFSDSVDYLIASNRKNFTVFPVLINAYHPSVDEAHMRAALERANVILRQADVALGLSGFRPNHHLGDALADGRIKGLAEYAQIVGLGFSEVLATSAKGLKISVMSTAADSIKLPKPEEARQPNPMLHEVSGAANRDSPVMVVKPGATVDLTARTIAHELGHILGLEHLKDGPTKDPGDLMTAGSPPVTQFVISSDPDKGLENVTISLGDRAMVAGSKVQVIWGRSGARKSPARRTEYGSGAAVDASGDHLIGEPGYRDLRSLQVGSQGDLDRIQWLLELGGELPSVIGENAIFKILIDGDADTNSGAAVLGQAGIDREITLVVFNDVEGRHALAQQTTHPGAGSSLIIPAPAIRPRTTSIDGEFPGDFQDGDIIELFVRNDVLGLVADQVPVAAVSLTAVDEVADSVQLIYDRARWQGDPSLVLDREFATPGEMVTFTVTGLTPGDAFELTVGGQSAAAGTLDGSGAFSDFFAAQAAVSEDVQFVIIVDQSYRFAESVIVIPSLVFGDGFE